MTAKNKPPKLGMVMDPIVNINIRADSSFAMLLAAQRRGWEVLYMEMGDLFLRDGRAHARLRQITVEDNPRNWFSFTDSYIAPLDTLDVVFMRKDPPFDREYLLATYLLEHAETLGAWVINKPQSMRDVNEKLYTAWFPLCCPPTLVSSRIDLLKTFLHEQTEIILKPLDRMGGESVFRVRVDDPNTTVIMEVLTQRGKNFVMAQRFIPEISAGDKRILLIDGKPVPYALARIPAAGETRANLAAGGQAKGVALSEHDYWICEQLGETLRKKGLLFVGLDVIGDYLTEINVTSPTGIRQLDAFYQLDIAGQFLDRIAERLESR